MSCSLIELAFLLDNGGRKMNDTLASSILRLSSLTGLTWWRRLGRQSLPKSIHFPYQLAARQPTGTEKKVLGGPKALQTSQRTPTA
jgi:hypothetical protein